MHDGVHDLIYIYIWNLFGHEGGFDGGFKQQPQNLVLMERSFHKVRADGRLETELAVV